MTFFTEIEKKNPKIYVEAEKTFNSQSNPEQKEICWSYYNILLQVILQNHSNKICMVLAQHTHTHTHTHTQTHGIEERTQK
jgi:uncharacterized protein affecting Mg2+/Co2+ transport